MAVLVQAAGAFAYLTLWRTVFAPDFDVNDFKAYYAGALALGEGRPDLLYPEASTLNLGLLPDQPWTRFAVERGVPYPSGYIYPPFLAVTLRPLTALPYHRANQAWFLANVLLFAAASAALVTWRPGGAGAAAGCGILFLALAFHPVYRAFATGQVSLLMLFLLAGALWCLTRKHDATAGSLVGLAAAVKLTPAILVVFFLAAKRYRAAAASVAAGVAALIVSVAGAGWENHLRFVREMLPALSRGAATFANQSLGGFMARLGMDVTMNAFEFVDEPAWLRVAERAASAAVLASALWLGARLAARGAAAEGYGLVVIASLIASPISWEHHYVLALIPAAVLLTRMSEPGRLASAEALVAVVACALMAANAYDLIRNHLAYAPARLAISYALYGAALMALVIGRRAFATAPEPSA